MRILVVEKDPKLRASLTRMLVGQRFSVDETSSGKEAVQKYQTFDYSAVILAMDLPDVHGFHVLVKMRQLNENVPVIIISPDETIVSAVKMVKAGAYDYIPKSNMGHLASVVLTAITIGESPEMVHEQMQTEGQPKGAEIHREYDRVPFAQEIKVDDKYKAKSINLSVGGMYIYTGRPHKVGSTCTLKFLLFDKIIHIDGIIRQSEFSVGMGVEFVNLHPQIRKALEVFIATLKMEQKPSEVENPWILVISDDTSALRMYKSQFMLSGFSILETKSLDKAAEYLRARDISSIVIDMDMKEIDALETVRSIKSVTTLAKIPIVVFTSSYSIKNTESIKSAGAAYIASRMTTPPKKLSSVLKELLE